MDSILEVNGLVKRYPAFFLDNISFSLPEGCVLGFIGANGAGKTTTIRSILNLAHKDAGAIKIFGLDTVKHEQEIKDRIGIVMDGSYFYNELSMQDMKSIIAPAYSKWSDADYRSYMEKFELDPKQKISTLSKGMRMKFALVLALSHQAELLIMDEPTSGLDPLSREEFCDIVLQLVRDEGVSVLFSTHITSDLMRIADDIVYISEGKILAACPLKELLGKYKLAHFSSLADATAANAIGVKSVKDGYEGLLPRDAKILSDVTLSDATIDNIIVHLEKANEEKKHG